MAIAAYHCWIVFNSISASSLSASSSYFSSSSTRTFQTHTEFHKTTFQRLFNLSFSPIIIFSCNRNTFHFHIATSGRKSTHRIEVCFHSTRKQKRVKENLTQNQELSTDRPFPAFQFLSSASPRAIALRNFHFPIGRPKRN